MRHMSDGPDVDRGLAADDLRRERGQTRNVEFGKILGHELRGRGALAGWCALGRRLHFFLGGGGGVLARSFVGA